MNPALQNIETGSSHTIRETNHGSHGHSSKDTYSRIWEKSVIDIKNKLPEPFFNTFIRDLTTLHPQTEGDVFRIYTDESILLHVKDKYSDLIEKSMASNGFKGQVSLLAKIPVNTAKDYKPDTEEDFYIPCPENFSFIESVCSKSLRHPSVFIEGRSGSGKSHLSRYFRQIFSQKEYSFQYYTLEEFILKIGSSIRDKSIQEWKQELRNHDFLMIDDFQFIKKTALHSQEEIRKLIDACSENGNQIIFFSDRPLVKLPLRDDLLSRMQSGRLETLLPPDQEGRFKLLKSECKNNNIDLKDSDLKLISSRIRDDMRKLKSVPLRLIHRNTSGDVISHISDLFTPELPIQPEEILKTVADHFQISVDAITGSARDRKFSLPRQIAAYLMGELLQLKLSRIAEILNRKDHSSIIHFKKNLEKKVQNDLFLNREIQQIRLKIEQNIC
ncbi:MAG: DnaA/Hda family protein [Spirochaetia bacterium]|nr:DnaA/Hda family protein [Spirochaetia bacterium]